VTQSPNEHGVYEAEATEVLARRGRSYAAINLCQCDDGLYRYSLDVSYSYGGFCGPISDSAEGFDTFNRAKEAAIHALLRRFPKAWASEPQSVHDELRDMKAAVEAKVREPTLF
jgi:hypothetical protein